MTDIEQIKAMLDRLAQQGDVSVLKAPLSEMAQALTDMVAFQEKPREEAQALATALATALKGLSFPITVNPTPVTVQPAQITVQAPNVTVQAPAAAAAAQPTGWTVTVTSRDASDRVRTISLKPE